MALLIWIFYMITGFLIRGFASFACSSLDYITTSIILYVTQGIITLVSIAFFKGYLSGSHIKKFRLFEWKIYLLCLLIGIGICMSHRLVFMLFPQLGLGTFNRIGSEAYIAIQDSLKNPVIFICMCFILPVLEELFFRGVLYNSIARYHGTIYAIIFSSILFGLSHMNTVQFISSIYMGFIIGYVISITKDLRFGILIHIANNTHSLSLNFFNKSNDISFYITALSIITGYLILIFSIILLKRCVKDQVWFPQG